MKNLLFGLVVASTVASPAMGHAAGQPFNYGPSASTAGSAGTISTCTTAITCTAGEKGKACFSNAQNRIVFCNGANSWIPMISTTLVSASTL